MTSRLKETLPFHLFIRRSKVLQMYKDFRRASRKVKDLDLRGSLKSQIHSEFKSHQGKDDAAAIKGLLGEGIRTLGKLRSMSEEAEKADANINREEDLDGKDYGRVGSGWPWSR